MPDERPAPARDQDSARLAEPAPRGLEGIELVRYIGKAGGQSVYTDMTPAEWDGISRFPDVMAHLMMRVTATLATALGHEPTNVEWELIYVQKGASLA